MVGYRCACRVAVVIARHPALPIVYAVSQFEGTVRAYREFPDRDEIAPDGLAWEAGAAACHVSVSPGGSFLTVVC